MPRNSIAEARNTREAILRRSVEVASVEGLEGLTFGRLADDLQLSKAGLVGHFGSKVQLQLATLERAVAMFRREVIDPSEEAAPGLPRLRRICDAWCGYIDRSAFPGGCFISAASFELDDRPGEVRDMLVDMERTWRAILTKQARLAVEAGQLPPGTDPKQVAYELMALALGAVQARQLLDDKSAGRRCRVAMKRVLRAQ
jgi:AcrR family transcriptional regulator